MTSLTGRTILLTGASGGIGSAIAAAVGAAGAHVIAHYGRHRSGAEQATAVIPEDRKLLLQVDLSREGAAAELWTQAVGWRGHVDVLVNNAAVMPQAGAADGDDAWSEAWRQVLAVNVQTPADLIRHATMHFVERGGGVLITMSSWAAQRGSGNPKLAAYAASKASLAAVTKTMARAYAREGVLGYCIAPGAVHTDMTLRSAENQGGLEAVTAGLVMGEMVPPTEVAELVAVLATGTHRHLSGATLDVNGASYIR